MCCIGGIVPGGQLDIRLCGCSAGIGNGYSLGVGAGGAGQLDAFVVAIPVLDGNGIISGCGGVFPDGFGHLPGYFLVLSNTVQGSASANFKAIVGFILRAVVVVPEAFLAIDVLCICRRLGCYIHAAAVHNSTHI